MKPPVIAYAADSGAFSAWLTQSTSLSDGYDFVAVFAREKILNYLNNKPIAMLVVQLDRQDSFLGPVLDFIQSTMPDLPIIGFVTNDEHELLKNRPGLNFYFLGRMTSAQQMHAEINRTFQKFSDGGALQSISPGVLLQLIEMEKKSCTVRLFDPERLKSGALFFVEGDLFDARLFQSHGETSACEIVAWGKPTAWIENRCHITTKNIRVGNKAILLEALRRQEPSNPADGLNPVTTALTDHGSQLTESRPSAESSPIPAPKQDVTPGQPTVASVTINRVAAALSPDPSHSLLVDKVYSDPAQTSLAKQFALAGSIMDAGRLQCGFMASRIGEHGFFVCLDETVCVRTSNGCRRESILQSLFRLK
ncbi:MAG: DUF4388 domain-containing protein [Deltaproteobacteria bacterium]|nr:DUF4388 domain-containing protein [Deltaproteobacteria bacterium]